jgi:hypothetical protein
MLNVQADERISLNAGTSDQRRAGYSDLPVNSPAYPELLFDLFLIYHST